MRLKPENHRKKVADGDAGADLRTPRICAGCFVAAHRNRAMNSYEKNFPAGISG
jgi:hypothetical protein